MILLSWAALLLPWEHCHSECHERLQPALGNHECHDEGCDDDRSGEERHDQIEFVSLRPEPGASAPLPLILDAAPLRLAQPVSSAAPEVPVRREFRPPGLTRSVVLLL